MIRMIRGDSCDSWCLPSNEREGRSRDTPARRAPCADDEIETELFAAGQVADGFLIALAAGASSVHRSLVSGYNLGGGA
jgi:hypothetical protein